MVDYSFSEMKNNVALEGLRGSTKELANTLWNKFQAVELNELEACMVRLDLAKNLCVFILRSSNQKSVDFKIELYDDGYYDMFVNDEEVVIQQKIELGSLGFIVTHLKSTVEEELIEDVEGKTVKKRLRFYWGGKTINVVGSISLLSWFLKKTNKRKITYSPWIDC